MVTKRLLEAARRGNVDVLKNLLENNPSILDDFKRESPEEPLLHEAVKHHQLDFVHLLITKDPKSAIEMDNDGYRPLDIAVTKGNQVIVGEILGVDRDLCRLKGKDGWTALHHAAKAGRVDIIYILQESCLDSIGYYNDDGKNALAVAGAHHQLSVIDALIEWERDYHYLMRKSSLQAADLTKQNKIIKKNTKFIPGILTSCLELFLNCLYDSNPY